MKTKKTQKNAADGSVANADLLAGSFPRIEPDTTEGINEDGFVVRFDDHLAWQWVSRRDMETLAGECKRLFG